MNAYGRFKSHSNNRLNAANLKKLDSRDPLKTYLTDSESHDVSRGLAQMSDSFCFSDIHQTDEVVLGSNPMFNFEMSHLDLNSINETSGSDTTSETRSIAGVSDFTGTSVGKPVDERLETLSEKFDVGVPHENIFRRLKKVNQDIVSVDNSSKHKLAVKTEKKLLFSLLNKISTSLTSISQNPRETILTSFRSLEEIKSHKDFVFNKKKSAGKAFHADLIKFNSSNAKPLSEHPSVDDQMMFGMITKETLGLNSINDGAFGNLCRLLVNRNVAIKTTDGYKINPEASDKDIQALLERVKDEAADRFSDGDVTNIRGIEKDVSRDTLGEVSVVSKLVDLRTGQIRRLNKFDFETQGSGIPQSLKKSFGEFIKYSKAYTKYEDLSTAAEKVHKKALALSKNPLPEGLLDNLQSDITRLETDNNDYKEGVDGIIDSLNQSEDVNRLLTLREAQIKLNHSIEELDKEFNIKSETLGFRVKKVASDLGNGVLSPITSPLHALKEVMKSGKVKGEPSRTTFQEVAKSSSEALKKLAEKVGDLSVWLLGPIGSGLEFLYSHTKSNDLPEALGRAVETMNVGKLGRRFKGILNKHDFCNLPPLSGRTESSKAISEEAFKIFQENGVIRDDGSIDLKTLVTGKIDVNEIESRLSKFIRKTYDKYNVKGYDNLSSQQQDELPEHKAKEFLGNVINKLKTVEMVKGHAYVAEEMQSGLDEIKNTSGWVAAVGAGIGAVVAPPIIILIGIVSGGLSLSSATTKIAGGLAHSDIASRHHEEMFADIDQSEFNDIGKSLYSESKINILRIQDQIVNDAAHAAAMIASIGGAAILSGDTVTPQTFSDGIQGSFDVSEGSIAQPGALKGVSATTAAYNADYSQASNAGNDTIGNADSLKQKQAEQIIRDNIRAKMRSKGKAAENSAYGRPELRRG